MRYFIELSYNGQAYHGWQIQPNASSVQEQINKALSTLLREEINIVGAGRTDAGVHAEQMFAHFDLDKPLDRQEVLQRMNSFLPEDIVLHRIFEVGHDTHARFDATARTYEYRIWLGRNPFTTHTTWQLYHQELDVKRMNEAATILKDYEDFQCFSKSKTDVKTYRCKITEAQWRVEGSLLIFQISADRFLRNMVRAIVGTLIDIGSGKLTKDELIDIIKSKDRSKAGFSVPAHGLFLTKVVYPKELLT